MSATTGTAACRSRCDAPPVDNLDLAIRQCRLLLMPSGGGFCSAAAGTLLKVPNTDLVLMFVCHMRIAHRGS
eukprot:6188228-Pleurochrysis_carterae.AAC.4